MKEILNEQKNERDLERNEDDADADEEEEDYEDDTLPDLETSPGEFLFFGLEIEHQQYVIFQFVKS